MEIDLVAWLSLALRWLHVITGIAWIGSSFYFIWLDNSLTPPEDEKDKKDGVQGELWAVHGGGFYHKKKYLVAPSHMPAELHWFKWESYFTWLSGFLLLALVYYWGADMFLIDRSKIAFERWQAVLTGLGFIAGGWVFYNSLCKSEVGANSRLFGLIWFGALTAAAYALDQIFTGRGAYIHVGAIIGTVMAANVFMIIIPNQKIVVADLLAGRKPDPALGKKAKQRSLHNNYMTLPVLLIMISNHYPMLYAHEYNWLILSGLCAVAFPIRHFFNLKHKGYAHVDYTWIGAGVLGFIAIMFLAAAAQTGAIGNMKVTDEQAHAVIKTHCVTCHSAKPTHEGILTPPHDLAYETIEDIKKNAQLIYEQAVMSDAMPLGNETGMTKAERETLGAWIKGLKH